MSQSLLRRAGFSLVALAASTFAVAAVAPTASATVTLSVPCSGSGGGGAGLQTAVAAANAGGGGTITLAAGCTYTLTAAQSGGHDSAASGLVIKSSVSIIGNNATVARDPAAVDFGVLEVDTGTVGVANLTLTGGQINGINHGAGVSQFGGALTLTDVDVVGNTGLSTNQPNPGGISLVGGSANLTQVTVANNSSPYIVALNVQESTTITKSTIAGNTGGGISGEAIATSSGTYLTLAGDLVSNSGVPQECYPSSGAPHDNGYNFASDRSGANSCGLSAATDGAAGTVSPLEDLGGGIQAVVPRLGSAAANGIPTSSGLCAGTDPRGVPRPQGSGCDAGAAEKPVADVTLSTTGASVSEGTPWTLTLTATTNTSVLGMPTRAFPLYQGSVSDGRSTIVTLNGGSPDTATYTPFPLALGAQHYFVYYFPATYPDDDRFSYAFATTSADVTVTPAPTVPCSGAGGGAAGIASAITAANAANGGGISLEPGCTYTLTSVAATEHGPNGLPVVSKPFVIRGNGALLTRDSAAPLLRLLDVNYNSKLALYDLTLTGGASSDTAGAVQVNGGGYLYADSINVSGNSSSSTYGGGALWNNGTMTLVNSTVSHNSTTSGPGGAIVTTTGGLTIDSDTIVDNTAAQAPAGVFGFIGGHAAVARTLLSNGPGQDCGGTLPVDNGYVYSDDTSCGLTAGTSVQNAGIAANLVESSYDGATLFAMPDGGPGKNAIPRASCMQPGGGTVFDSTSVIAPDERGVLRPQSGNCDAGAVEVAHVSLSLTLDTSTVDSGDTVTFAVTATSPPGSPPNGTVDYSDLRGVSQSVPLSGPSPATVSVPMVAGPAGMYFVDFNYTGDGTQDAAFSLPYSVDVRPVINSVTPARGPGVGGTTVTIKGLGLAGVNQVMFGSHAGTHLTHVSATQLTVVAPGNPAGNVDIQLFSRTGGSPNEITPADVFTYTPTVTALSPNSGPKVGGTVVTITGTRFTRTSKVLFGTKQAAVTFVSTTTLTATAPSHAGGPVDVRVSTAGVLSPVGSADVFTYATTVAAGRARAI